jgi:hypothetical protein
MSHLWLDRKRARPEIPAQFAEPSRYGEVVPFMRVKQSFLRRPTAAFSAFQPRFYLQPRFCLQERSPDSILTYFCYVLLRWRVFFVVMCALVTMLLYSYLVRRPSCRSLHPALIMAALTGNSLEVRSLWHAFNLGFTPFLLLKFKSMA